MSSNVSERALAAEILERGTANENAKMNATERRRSGFMAARFGRHAKCAFKQKCISSHAARFKAISPVDRKVRVRRLLVQRHL